jgi:hypothetical protein
MMIDLPAAIAADLVDGSRTRIAVVLRLQAALEVIERVYPALDTAEPKTILDELLERTESGSFAEVHVVPVATAVEEEVEVDHEAAPEAEEAPAVEATAESV